MNLGLVPVLIQLTVLVDQITVSMDLVVLFRFYFRGRLNQSAVV